MKYQKLLSVFTSYKSVFVRFFLILTSYAVVFLMLCAYAQDTKHTEYQIKSAFIYNFAKFVYWPDGSDDNTLSLYVIGKASFCKDLDTIEGKIIRGKTLQIKRIKSLQNIKEGNLLFITSAEKHNLENIINSVRGLSLLTIGDTEGFAERGVMINLYIEDESVRFEINVEASRREGLEISSKLLKLARIVTSNPKR